MAHERGEAARGLVAEEVPKYSGPPLTEDQKGVLAVMYRLTRGRTDVVVPRSELRPEFRRYMRLTPEEKDAYAEESFRIADKDRS